MSWNNITGDERILPSGSNANEIRFENGKPKRVRLIARHANDEPYTYLEHAIENETFENGKSVRNFRTVRCPKTAKNPNAHCPLCDGQRARRRVRSVTNVKDENGQIQKLNAGDSVWIPIGTARKLGLQVYDMEWAIMRTGEGRNDTEYTVTNLGASQIQITPEDMAQLFDIETEYAPHTIEEMQTICESIGIDWNFITTPPSLEYPTLEAALAHVMPNGKYKDQTFKQIWESDMSNKGMINYLATRSDRITAEKAAAQIILVNLGGANIEGVPKYGLNAPTTPPTTPPPAAPPTTPPPATPATPPTTPPPASPTTPPPTTGGVNRAGIINEINSIFATSEKFKAGGFQLISDTMSKAGNGKRNIADFTDAELTALLELCKA